MLFKLAINFKPAANLDGLELTEADVTPLRIDIIVIQDSKTKDLILKLVNLLPVVVNTEVKLEGFGNIKSSAMEIVLTGHPDDEDTTPIISEIEAGENFRKTLPGYSFTIIRLRTDKK